MTPKEVLAFAKEQGAKMVDFKFLDFLGTWQHFSNPISELGEADFENGYGFDGSVSAVGSPFTRAICSSFPILRRL